MAKKRPSSSEYLRVAKQILETKPSEMYSALGQQAETKARQTNKNQEIQCSKKHKS